MAEYEAAPTSQPDKYTGEGYGPDVATRGSQPVASKGSPYREDGPGAEGPGRGSKTGGLPHRGSPLHRSDGPGAAGPGRGSKSGRLSHRESPLLVADVESEEDLPSKGFKSGPSRGEPTKEGVDKTMDPDSASASTHPTEQDTDLDSTVSKPGHPGAGDMTKPSDEYDDEPDESLAERLWGLTEMFPESLRDTTYTVTCKTLCGIKGFYGLSRNIVWIIVSSSVILFAPLIFEVERQQMEEMQRTQQKQVLLGPNAAVSGSGVPMPPMR